MKLQNTKHLATVFKYPFLLLTIVVVFNSCDIKDSNISPDNSFIRIYESANVDEQYHPEAVLQLDDKNYLIVSSMVVDSGLTNYPQVRITALNPSGKVLASLALPENYTNAVPGWIQIGGKQYFVCMDDGIFDVKILEVGLNGEELSYNEIASLDRKLPVYAWSNGSQILILSYDRFAYRSVVDAFDVNFNPVWSSEIAGNEDSFAELRKHLRKEGKYLPFFIGQVGISASDGYYINCIANYSLAMVFLNVVGSETGRLYTYQDEGVLSSALHLKGDTFALARYHTGDNYVYPKVSIDIATSENSNDLPGALYISQLGRESLMDMLLYEHKDKTYIVYGSTSKSNEVMLLFFNIETGEQVYTYSLGSGNPVKVIDIINTEDGGIAVLGETEMYESYKRIFFAKIDPDQLDI